MSRILGQSPRFSFAGQAADEGLAAGEPGK